MALNIELIVGTYEEFLLGYKVAFKDEKQVLVQSFADRAHVGAIKCVAVHKHLIASGATDDRIFIYDMRARKQVQILLSHQGTVNALVFTPDSTHLLSGGDDAQMLATRLNTWCVEGTWKQAHSGKAVTHIICHPSGKLALSLGSDLTLRTWNLIKGRVAYKKNLKSHASLGMQPDNLFWSPTGEYFSLTGQRVVEIWSIKKATVVSSYKTTAKPTTLCWVSDKICLVGQEDGNIIQINIDENLEKPNVFQAHKARVKSLTCVNTIIGSASSDGEIKLWEYFEQSSKLCEIAGTNIGCRPTCLGLLDVSQFECGASKTAEKMELMQPIPIAEKKKQTQHRGTVVIEYENEDRANGKN